MGIDRLDQAGDILRSSRAGNINRKGHVLETSRYVCDSEEPAQIEPALSGHLDAIEWDIKHPGIRRVDDFLAGAKGGENQLDRSGTGVGAADQRWLVHVETEFADLHLGAVLVDECGRRGERDHGWFRGVAQIRPHLFDDCSESIDLLYSHCRSPLMTPAARLSPRPRLLPEAVFYSY